jgi:NTP pyrophosphatase (non-canonical NTP hydrolase)
MNAHQDGMHEGERPARAEGEGFARLAEIMQRLLGEGGCPWDKEQTLASLRQYVLEEAQETADAIDELLAVEAQIRAARGLPPDDPAPPPGFATSHDDKGTAHAHHPAQIDFAQEASASGAPLGDEPIPAELQAKWDAAKKHLVLELGDLLLQPVFQGELGALMGYFTLDDIIAGICEKLIRRHPHVFSDAEAKTAEDVLDNWKRIKAGEKDNF